MRVWGFSVASDRGRATVIGVEALGSAIGPQKGRVFELAASPNEPLPSHMKRLLDATVTLLSGEPPDGVVFRLLDYSSRGRAERTTRAHALAEGVVLAAAMSVTDNVIALPPVQLAQKCATDKGALDASAQSVFGRRYAEAGAAALAGLSMLDGPSLGS